MKNHYEILGLKQFASTDEIKKDIESYPENFFLTRTTTIHIS
jgi:hypothetical protein